MRWALALALSIASLALALLQPAPAHAQPATRDDGFIGEAPQRLEVDDCPALPVMTQAELLKLGGERYNRGEQLYTQGDYPGAVSELVLSYCTLPYYLMLKDIGQAYERELEYDKAIGYLERYATQVPENAKKLDACSPDPQKDKENVLKRIDVLRRLPGHVLVQADRTGPHGERAQVMIATPTVTAATGNVGEQLSVQRGHYTMVVHLDGYDPFTRAIDVEIGKPYTYFAKLEPLKGTVTLQVVPADARIFIDDRFVAFGHYSAVLPARTYTLSVEAPGRTTQRRILAVLPNKIVPQQVELYPEPQEGRLQALTYAAVGGGLATAGLLETTNSNVASGIGLIAGGVGGFVAASYLLPEPLALGTSSLAITTSVFGAVAGGATATLFTSKDNRVGPFAAIGGIAGAALGYLTGDRTRIRPGEAAVINSSLLLVTRYFTVSRTHAALIDVGGLIGAIGGVALEGILFQPKTGVMASNLDAETRSRIANFALGGMALGLITAGVITRDLDAPSLPIAPMLGKAVGVNGTATTFGIVAPW